MYKQNNFRAKTVKKEAVENIKDYSKNKVLITLAKPHSPQTITFIEDLDDPWFVYVKTFKTKSGIITDSSMIIAKDVDDWVNHRLHLGYEIVK